MSLRICRGNMTKDDRTANVTMQSGNSTLGMPSAAIIDTAIRVALLGLLAYWSMLLVRPFLTIALWSTVLAVALFPIYDWLAVRLGGRRCLAAVSVTIVTLLIVLGPVTWLGLGLIENLRALSERFVEGDLAIPAPFDTVKTWPLIGEYSYEVWALASNNLGAALKTIAPQLKPIGSILLGIAATGGVGMLKFIASVIISG